MSGSLAEQLGAIHQEFKARGHVYTPRPYQERVTKRHPDECRECNGLGQSNATLTAVIKTRAVVNGRERDVHRTTQLGSGCPACLGTGRL